MEGTVIIGLKELRSIIAECVRQELKVVHDPESLLTVDEVAEILKVHPGHIYRIKDKIGHIKEGSSVRFKRGDVDRYINSKIK